MSGPRLEFLAPQDAPVIVFRRVFQATPWLVFEAHALYLDGGAERGLTECHEHLDELLRALLSRPRERQGP